MYYHVPFVAHDSNLPPTQIAGTIRDDSLTGAPDEEWEEEVTITQRNERPQTIHRSALAQKEMERIPSQFEWYESP
jgi:hypothetical protein